MTMLKFARVLVGILFFLILNASLWAREKGWEAEWKRVVAASKKEGKVVVTGDPDPVMRREIPAKFTARYGIPVQFIGGRGSQIAAKLRVERRAGANSIDVFMAGIGTAANILYKEQMIDPLKPALILPEVTNPSMWKKGKQPFVDPEGKYIFRLLNYVVAILYINTTQVKRGDIKSMKDLLDPKWKGKIMTRDPTVGGSGSNDATKLYLMFGEEFVKGLYVDQKPIITRNRRQITDWLARGVHPISLTASDVEVKRMQKEGFPLDSIYDLSDLPGIVSGGDGMMALMNGAPHPNAARVFVNWMASREGLSVFSRSRLRATTRNDVDESFLPKEVIPQPGVEYFDSYGWEFTIKHRERVRRHMKKLLGR